MAQQMSAETDLKDVTECSICTEMFSDPRVLPCIHTFCFACLLNYGKDKQPGDTMSCPLCKKEFAIPDDGLAAVQKNFFVEKLVHVRKLSAGKDVQHTYCDVCNSDDASVDDAAKPATMHCVHCEQNYCAQCSRGHRIMKGTARHVQVEIGKQFQVTMKLPEATCEIHHGEEVKVFCLECKVAICLFCFIDSHQSHKCSDVEKVSTDLHEQLSRCSSKVTDLQKTIGEFLLYFQEKNDDFIDQISRIKEEINAATDKLIEGIQSDRMKLLSKVDSIKLKQDKQLETVKDELDQHTVVLESFRRYNETLLSSGTPFDVARSVKSLQQRADELAAFDVIGYVQHFLLLFTVKFMSSTILANRDGNLIGDVYEGRENLVMIKTETDADDINDHLQDGGNVEVQIGTDSCSYISDALVDTRPVEGESCFGIKIEVHGSGITDSSLDTGPVAGECRLGVNKEADGNSINGYLHDDEMGTYLCTVCNRHFTTIYGFNAHNQIHVGKRRYSRRYSCTECNRHFSLKDRFDFHVKRHLAIRNYYASFGDKSKLKTHKLMHGAKKFVCTVCNKQYPMQRKLFAHMKQHIRHSCTVCDKEFSSTRSLNAHKRRMHAEEKATLVNSGTRTRGTDGTGTPDFLDLDDILPLSLRLSL